MPYRARFSCLWCGTAYAARGGDDLEGWAQLCPTCLGRAGDNEFLRMRLRTALAERAAGRPSTSSAEDRAAGDGAAGSGDSLPSGSDPVA